MAAICANSRYPRRYCLGLIEASQISRLFFVCPRIRGVIASASLKQRRQLQGAQSPAGYPRRYCLGLIEAGACRRSASRLWSYPRRYCLGLIEAGTGPGKAKPGLGGIRGVIASASLKRAGNCGVVADASGIRGVIASASLKLEFTDTRKPTKIRYPRRYCLGLIEANSTNRLLRMCDNCIRGVIASASLKRKPARYVLDGNFVYPRRYCLGLIEATDNMDCD